ncbi:MAG: phosphatidylserine/phosphatidylglycerophosphate/cardiolipin synthase family protein [Opitutales bacterium]
MFWNRLEAYSVPESMSDERAYLEAILGARFSDGNKVEILVNGGEIFPAMLRAIRQARSSIHFLTFVYWSGDVAERFAAALADKASEGITVRVLLDSYGANAMPKKYLRRMETAGVEVGWFRPLLRAAPWKTDHRTHRKVLVCDGEVAFVGGVGIAEEWDGHARNPGEWRDTHFQITGPAVVELGATFWDNWLEVSHYRLPSAQEVIVSPQPIELLDGSSIMVVRSSASPHTSEVTSLFSALFKLATRQIIIQTPYFVLDQTFRDILIETARRGVSIEVMIPGKYLDRRYESWAAARDIDELLTEGVSFHIYQKTMLHTKIFLIDEGLSCIGSANFNQRSMHKDDEVMLVVDDTRVWQRLHEEYRNDLRSSEKVGNSRYWERPWRKKLLGRLIRPFRQQL